MGYELGVMSYEFGVIVEIKKKEKKEIWRTVLLFVKTSE
tara:strand:- start:22 stop:138 length:117 start_codon:yes stop_codon:yes gene_type:complete